MTADDEAELVDREKGGLMNAADIHDVSITLYSAKKPSCALALLENNLNYNKRTVWILYAF